MDNNNLMLALAKTDLAQLQEVVAQISAVSQVTVMKPASTSLVMMGAKDSVQADPFYLGEVLITQCTVRVNDITGYGFVMGEDNERAYCLAVLDAVLHGEHSKTTELDAFIASQATILRNEKIRDYAAIAQTRVRFDSMLEG